MIKLIFLLSCGKVFFLLSRGISTFSQDVSRASRAGECDTGDRRFESHLTQQTARIRKKQNGRSENILSQQSGQLPEYLTRLTLIYGHRFLSRGITRNSGAVFFSKGKKKGRNGKHVLPEKYHLSPPRPAIYFAIPMWHISENAPYTVDPPPPPANFPPPLPAHSPPPPRHKLFLNLIMFIFL